MVLFPAIITDKPSVDLLKKSLGGDPSQEGLEEVSSKSLSTQALQGKKQDSNEVSVVFMTHPFIFPNWFFSVIMAYCFFITFMVLNLQHFHCISDPLWL